LLELGALYEMQRRSRLNYTLERTGDLISINSLECLLRVSCGRDNAASN